MADSFNPDQYLAATDSGSGFNPDQYLAATSSGGNQSYSQPSPGGEPNNVGHTPPGVAMKQDMYGPGIQDTTINDLSMLDAARSVPSVLNAGAGLVAKGIGAGLDALPATKNVLPTIDRIANNYTLKSFGGSPGQIQKMAAGRDGREALDAAARYARDKGLGDVWSTSIGRENTMKDLVNATGKKVGDLRNEAGAGQKTSDLIKMAQDKYGSKYASGVDSGESGEFQKALDEVMKMSPVKEIPQSEQIGSYLENYPEGGSHNLNVTEPNPLYTDVPENIKPQLNTAPPVTKDPRMIDLGLPPKGVPENPDFPLPYKNPMFLSGEPTLSRSAEIPIHPYENARNSLEEFDAPDYDVQNKNPSNAEIAKTATRLNKYASDQSGILRPNSATTDVADLISHENNADIAQKLGSGKAKQYIEALDEQSKLHPLEHLQTKGELREAAGRGSMFDKIKDKFGYRLAAQSVAGIHDALKGKDIASYLNSIRGPRAQMAPGLTKEIMDYVNSKRKDDEE